MFTVFSLKSFLPKTINKKIVSITSITKTNWNNICINISSLLSRFDLPYNIIVEIENEEVSINIIKVTNTTTGTKIHTRNPPGKMDTVPTTPTQIKKLNTKNGIDKSLINSIILRISLRTFGTFCVVIASLIENTILIMLTTSKPNPNNTNKTLLLEKHKIRTKLYNATKNAVLKNHLTSQSPLI